VLATATAPHPLTQQQSFGLLPLPVHAGVPWNRFRVNPLPDLLGLLPWILPPEPLAQPDRFGDAVDARTATLALRSEQGSQEAGCAVLQLGISSEELAVLPHSWAKRAISCGQRRVDVGWDGGVLPSVMASVVEPHFRIRSERRVHRSEGPDIHSQGH
jgi:hypothetical protein